MKLALSTICFLMLCSFALLAQDAKAPMSDQKFVDFAAQTDMVEANLGDLAQNVGDAEAVKDYGQMLAIDHTTDYQKLQSVAQQAGLSVPTAIDAEHNKSMVGPMHALKGAAFDKKFSHDMAVGHAQAIAVYKKEADGTQNPVLKTYAQETLATLQKHEDDAKTLQPGKTAGGQ
jgi:putative membrane protein